MMTIAATVNGRNKSMKKRVKKKHEHRYWLRNAKERRAVWQEFLESFSELAPEELAELKEQEHESDSNDTE